MAKTFDTSFIPQQPLVHVERKTKRHEPINFALVLALIVFFVSLAVAGGVYLYEVQIENRIVQKEKELASLEEKISTDRINLYKRTDTRLTLAKTLLDGHDVFSSMLNFLEETTAQNVGLTKLSYGKNADDYVLSVEGEATSYAAVYFQAQSWRNWQIDKHYVKSVEIGELSLSEDSGIITFGALIFFDPQYIKYNLLLQAEKEEQYQDSKSHETETTSASPLPAGIPEKINATHQ